MTVTITTKTTAAAPGKAVQLTVTSDNADCTHVELYATAAPAGSALHKSLAECAAVQVRATSEGGFQLDQPAEHRLGLEAAGRYTFIAHEMQVNAITYGGGYAGDPAGLPTPTKLAESTATVETAQRLTFPVGVAGLGSASVAVWVAGGVVVRTECETHGEATPAILAGREPRSAAAVESADVVAALDALVGYDVTALADELEDLCTEIKARLAEHFRKTAGSTHAAADTVNAGLVDALPASPATPVGWAATAQGASNALRLHMANSTPTSTGAAGFHVATGTGEASPDVDNLPKAPAGNTASQMALTCTALAAIHDAYEFHRVNDDVHGAADVAALPALGAWLSMHRAFLRAVHSVTDSPTETSGSAAALLVAGATMAPLRA